jgi:hypothetical protein
MKYFISSLGYWSKNVTSILNKNILLLKKKEKINNLKDSVSKKGLNMKPYIG